MKNQRLKTLIGLCLSASVLLLYSSCDGLQSSETDYSITLSSDSLSFESSGGTQTVTVYAAAEWTVAGECDWCEVSFGQDDSVVSFSVSPNMDTVDREYTYTFSCGEQSTGLTIFQFRGEPALNDDEIIQFNDPNFLKAVLANGVDADGDGQISVGEAKAVTYLELYTVTEDGYTTGYDITDLTEISYFVNLEWLDCGSNLYEELNLSDNRKLIYVIGIGGKVAEVDVSGCADLQYLDLRWNQLTQLDISSNPRLTELLCDYNELSAIDVSNNPELKTLAVSDNNLREIDLSNCTKLESLGCVSNQISQLDLSANPNLTWMQCGDNNLTELDVSEYEHMTFLDCSGNQISRMDVSGILDLAEFWCSGNPFEELIIAEAHRDASWYDGVYEEYADVIVVK